MQSIVALCQGLTEQLISTTCMHELASSPGYHAHVASNGAIDLYPLGGGKNI